MIIIQAMFSATNRNPGRTFQLDGQAPIVLVRRQDRVDRVYGSFPPAVTVDSNG